MRLETLAPAKVNLSLHVGPPKANGRHDLMSLVVFADDNAADELRAQPARHFSLGVDGAYAKASGPAQHNLILQAARALDADMPDGVTSLAFRLVKHLPAAAGIGGGSADAAAALRLLIQIHGGDSVREIAQALAPQLGGDVLACFHGVPGMMSGEGERYEPMLGIPPLPALLVNSGAHCPTGDVFRAYDAHAPSQVPEHPLPPAGRSRDADFIGWLDTQTTNSLQAAAINLVPDIQIVLDELNQLPDVRLVRMSGSGATCFALFDSLDICEKANEIIAQRHPTWWVRPTLLGRGVV